MLETGTGHAAGAAIAEIGSHDGHLGRTANRQSIMRAVPDGEVLETEIAHLARTLRRKRNALAAGCMLVGAHPVILVGIYRRLGQGRTLDHKIAERNVVQVVGCVDDRNGGIAGRRVGIGKDDRVPSLPRQCHPAWNAQAGRYGVQAFRQNDPSAA